MRKRVALEKRNLNILVLILVLLPKIHKCLFDVPGPPVISNCGTPTEKVLEHLVLKLVMQQSKFYIKDSSDFIKETERNQRMDSKKFKEVPRMLLWSRQMWSVSIPVSLMILGWRL